MKFPKRRALEIYVKLCPEDSDVKNEIGDARRDAIAKEMQAILSTDDLDKAASVIGWWDFPAYVDKRKGARKFVRQAWDLR